MQENGVDPAVLNQAIWAFPQLAAIATSFAPGRTSSSGTSTLGAGHGGHALLRRNHGSAGLRDAAASYEVYAQADQLVTVIAELLFGQAVQGTHLVAGRLFTPRNTATMPAVWSRDDKD